MNSPRRRRKVTLVTSNKERLLIRCGNFFECVQSTPNGHASIGIEPTGDLMKTVRTFQGLLQSNSL